MTTQEIALAKLTNIIKFDKHQSDQRAQYIKAFCQMISSAKGEKEYVKELRPHEEAAQKEQRARIYYSLAQYAANKLISYVNRLKSVEDVKVSIITDNEIQKQQISEYLINFYNEKSLLEYVIELYTKQQKDDPNALILLSHYDVQDLQTGALIDRRINPELIDSSKIVELEERNGLIEYGIIKEQREIKHKEKNAITQAYLEKTESVNDFYVYMSGATLIMIRDVKSDFEQSIEIDEMPYDLLNANYQLIQIEKPTGKKETFRLYTIFNEGLPCPLLRVSGRIDNQDDDLRTSLLTLAESQFLELISRKSELDVNTAVHVFPQKFMIVSECDYTDADNNECNSGRCGTKVCPQCKGKGAKYHLSGQDLITVTIPKTATKEDIPDITKMVHYATHDEYINKALLGMVTDVLSRISDATFETNIFAGVTVNGGNQGTTPQNGVNETATKTMIDWQKLYMALKDDASHIEKMCSQIANYQAALSIPNNSVSVRYAFPKDFKFSTLNELLDEYKKAVDAGLPYDVIEKIVAKIIEKQSPDDIIAMKWALMKLKFKPFSDKSKDEVRFIIENRANDDKDRVLWENYDAIFDELRNEDETLVGQDYTTQKAKIYKKVDEFASSILYSQASNIDTLFSNVTN